MDRLIVQLKQLADKIAVQKTISGIQVASILNSLIQTAITESKRGTRRA
jgi:hypothetical protein